MCMHLHVYIHVCMGSYGGQKGVSDSLEPELQVVVTCPVLVLGTELGSSSRTQGFLSTESPLPRVLVFIEKNWHNFKPIKSIPLIAAVSILRPWTLPYATTVHLSKSRY